MAQFVSEVKDGSFSNLQLATYKGASSVRGSDGAGLYYGRKDVLCLPCPALGSGVPAT